MTTVVVRRSVAIAVSGLFFVVFGAFLVPFTGNPIRVYGCPPGGACTPLLFGVSTVAPVFLIGFGLALIGYGSYYYMKHQLTDGLTRGTGAHPLDL